MLRGVAELTWNRPRLVLAGVAVFVVVAAVFGLRVEDHLLAAGFTDSDSESERATALLRDELGYDANAGLVVLVRAPDGGELNVSDPEVRSEVARLSDELRDVRYVGRVIDPIEQRRAGAALLAEDGRSLVIAAHLTTQDLESFGGEAAEGAQEVIASDSLDVGIGGFAPGFNEVNDQTREDLTKAELIAFPILAVMLLLIFRGVVAAAIPLLIGVIAILGTFLVLRIMSAFVDTSLFALNISTALSLGLAVDYALLMISRYREELERGDERSAHRTMVMTAGRTVLFSGATVAAAMASLIVLPQRFLYSVGAAGASVGILSALIAVLAIPALLAVLGPRINALSIRRGPAVSDGSDGWYRLARWVMRHPVGVALASTAVLVAAALPLLWTVLTGPSAEAVPSNQPSYEVNEFIEDEYPRSVSEAVTVTVDGRAGDRELARLERSIARVEGIEGAATFVRVSPDVAYANFSPVGPALREPPQDAVRAIREAGGPAGTDVLVSGNTARFIDQKESLLAHLPVVVALVTLTTLVLLFMLTGSVVLPIKALIMNVMTLGATLGILVLAFQEGWLAGPLDYPGPNAVEVTSLVFLLAVIFGLATDYAVLVLGRITEQREAGASNEEAVATGIARTGRVITAAAAMIAVVFLAFAVSTIFFMKQIAVGQAVGVLIDATIVRALLVPSLMRLLGEWNWWAPAPLRRFHRRFGFSEG